MQDVVRDNAALAGAELNAKIAVEIFGWRALRGLDAVAAWDPGILKVKEYMRHIDCVWVDADNREVGCQQCGGGPPDYTGDIAAAWGIVEKLDPVLHLELKRYAVGWLAVFTAYDRSAWQEAAETPQQAICLAALAAVAQNPALKIPISEKII